MGKLLDHLKEQAAQGPIPEWRPEQAGEGLEGIIEYFEEFNAPHGLTRRCIVRKGDDTLAFFYLSRDVLKDWFDRLDPKPGERIAVLYLGMPEGKRYHDYTVAVER